jgi:hypothetical protein
VVLTKTIGGFDRATARFEADLRLLKAVDEISQGIAPQRDRD